MMLVFIDDIIVTIEVILTDDDYAFCGYEYIFRKNGTCIYKVFFAIVIEKSL